jgi:hypothetical protein
MSNQASTQQPAPFAAPLYHYALVNRETGRVDAYAKDASEANELSKRHKKCEGKLFRRGWPLAALQSLALVDRDTGETASYLPLCVGDPDPPAITANKDRTEFYVTAPPGSVVIVRNAETGDTMGRVDIARVPAKVPA